MGAMLQAPGCQVLGRAGPIWVSGHLGQGHGDGPAQELRTPSWGLHRHRPHWARAPSWHPHSHQHTIVLLDIWKPDLLKEGYA